MKFSSLLAVLAVAVFVTACQKKEQAPAVAGPGSAEYIIGQLDSSSGWIQLDGLEAVKQATNADTLAQVRSKVEGMATSKAVQPLVTTKAATVLFQKYGLVDPRHAEAYTHLLLNDPTMADALRKSGKLDKQATLRALAAKEKSAEEISRATDREADKAMARKLIANIEALKKEIGE